MPKLEVAWDSYLNETTDRLSDGLLLASLDPEGKPNVMTIGQGSIGIVWGRPMFVVLVYHSRYTYECIEATGDFTVNVPSPGMTEAVKLCGTVSGRDHDKFAECGFTVGQSQTIISPYIDECDLVYECQVVQHTDVVPENSAPEIIDEFDAGADFDRVYGEILRTLAEEDFPG